MTRDILVVACELTSPARAYGARVLASLAAMPIRSVAVAAVCIWQLIADG